MLKPTNKTSYKKDMRLLMKRQWDMSLHDDIYRKLVNEEPLPDHCRPHWLSGDWANHMECHVRGDWIIIYVPDPDQGTITFYRTGAHSDLL
jgi:mRNA interferase YafQ